MGGENRLYTVLAVAGGFFCLALSLFYQSPAAAALSGFFFFLSLAIWKYGYFLVPMVIKNAKIVEVGMNFEIPPSQDAIIGRKGGDFLASVFLAARLYESASERDAEGRAAMCMMFEKAISSAGFPFKACLLVSPLGLKNELEEIRAKRSVAESHKEKLAHGKQKSSELARLEREIAMWGRMLERLGGGEKPLEVVFYLSTTGSGITKEEALSRARSQARELSAVVGSSLSCEVEVLKGEEMKKCFWWDFFGPADADELSDETF